MKHLAYLTLVMVVALGVAGAAAQGKTAKAEKMKTLTALGVVTAVSSGSLTIESGKKSMTFVIDSNTHVAARGAGTVAREKKAAGAGGLMITEVVHQGDQVTVKYHDMGGTMHAADVQMRAPRTPPGAQKKR